MAVSSDNDGGSIVGRIFGDFTILEKLGAGGGGEVYRAEQVTLGREAVIKVISAESDDPSAGDRFLREARLASRLDHPYMAHVYGFGSEPDGTLWIAMELVRGTSLDELLRQGPIPLPRFIPFLERLCEVLFAAHEQGIVHRDIKPQNVMVVNHAGKLMPKLLDLGIARRDSDPRRQSADRDLEQRKQLLDKVLTDLGTRLLQSETMDITMEGTIVGTPQYMAPEQWLDSSSVDARSDLYSLAILAYQAIVGRNPFVSRQGDFMELLRAHNEDPLPRLPASLPVALHNVLSKGAAKKPADRFNTALEFSEAMRVASGLHRDAVTLPKIDKTLLETIVLDAPQPIAEATAMIEGAHSARQQLEAVLVTRQVTIRYLGILALASRGRVGPGGAKDDARVVNLLQRLSADRLTDLEWFTLVQELCRPFAARASAHPLPELVQLFFADGDVHHMADGARLWFELLEMTVPQIDAAPEEQLAAIEKLLPALSSVLQKTSFLFDYQLSVKREQSERWMGTRRIRRSIQPMNDTPPPANVPFLVDGEGMAVLTLEPLMQVFAPSGGMPEELFFLEGSGRHGARLAALPGPFERQSDEVWPWFSSHIVDLGTQGVDPSLVEKVPYKGLSTFTTDDADNYYGREREAEAFANRLKASHLLAVVGPSGAGKSSFVLAGVLPLLPRGCEAVVMRPGSNPLGTLFSKLQPRGIRIESDDVARLGDAIAQTLQAEQSLLLVVDQFEELVTLCAEPMLRSRFAHALISIADHPSGKLRVVFTLRDDFLIKIQQIDALRDRLSSSLQLVTTPAQDDLLRVVIEPARRVGYGFDDPELPLKMVEAVSEYPGALAMLSFTASQLWELRDRQLRQMRAKTYEALGGVGGALSHHAEATLGAMSNDEQSLVREVFRQLVTAQGTRAVMSRKEMLEVLGGTAVAQSVLEKFIAARLLVSSESADGDDRIEIIHEALIVSWPRLVAWSREDAETARFRDSLRASARQWDERGRPRGQLWRKEPLAEYKVWRTRFRGRLTQIEEAFAAASLRDELAGRRIKQGLAVTAFVVLSVALVLILRAYQESSRQYLALRQEQARLALVDEKPLDAMTFLAEAVGKGADNAATRWMSGLIRYQLSGTKRVEARHEQSIWWLASHSATHRIAAFVDDASLELLTSDGSRPPRKVATESSCLLGAFSHDGNRLVLACTDGKVRVVDVDSGALLATHSTGDALIMSLIVLANGTAVLAQLGVGVVRLDLATGERTTLYAQTGSNALALRMAPDERGFVLYGGPFDEYASSLRGFVWFDANTFKTLVADTTAMVRGVGISRDGRFVATGQADGTVALYDLRAKRWAWSKVAHATRVRNVEFSPDDLKFVSAGSDAVRAWSLTGETLWLTSDRADMSNVCWSPRGDRVFAGGIGAVLVSIEADNGDFVWRYPGHRGNIMGCVVSPDASTVFTSSLDGSVRSWDATKKTSERSVLRGALDVHAAPSGDRFAAISEDGIHLIEADASDLHIVRTTVPNDVGVGVSLSSSGLLGYLIGKEVRVVEVATGRELFKGSFAQAGLNLSMSEDGTRFTSLAEDSSAVMVLDKDTGLLPPAVVDTADLTNGPFITRDRFLTCSATGVLRLWDASTGKVVAQASAHKNICYADYDQGWVRTFSLDKGLSFRRLDGDTFGPAENVATSFGGEVIGRGAERHQLTATGLWAALSSDGAPLAVLPLRRKNFLRSAASSERLVFLDMYGRVSVFAPPPAAGAAEVIALEREQGVWRLDLQTGRLVER